MSLVLNQPTVRFIVLRKTQPMRVFTPSPLVAFNRADDDSQVIIIENFAQREITSRELIARAIVEEKQLAELMNATNPLAYA